MPGSRIALITACAAAALGQASAEVAIRDWTPQRYTAALEGDLGAPEIQWQYAYGGPGDDYAYDIAAAKDGGFLVAGRSAGEKGDPDAFVMKTDALGAVVWAKRWGGADVDIAFGVRELSDGTFAVAGWTKSKGAGEGDYFLLGLDANGATRFEKTFGGRGDDRCTQIIMTRDGGLALFGESYSFGKGDARFYLVKTDADGELQWEKSYDFGPLNDRGIALVEHKEGYLLVGNSMDSKSGSTATKSDGVAIMVDAKGEELWRKTFGGDGIDLLHHVTRLRDGRFLISGYTRSFGSQQADIWAIALAADGAVRYAKTIGGPDDDHNIMARAYGSGSVLAGYTKSFGEGEWNAQLLRLGGNGRLSWSHSFRGPKNDGATAVAPLPGGALAVTGYTESFGAGGEDMILMKIAPKGR
jgi:hypothetical protein